MFKKAEKKCQSQSHHEQARFISRSITINVDCVVLLQLLTCVGLRWRVRKEFTFHHVARCGGCRWAAARATSIAHWVVSARVWVEEQIAVVLLLLDYCTRHFFRCQRWTLMMMMRRWSMMWADWWRQKLKCLRLVLFMSVVVLLRVAMMAAARTRAGLCRWWVACWVTATCAARTRLHVSVLDRWWSWVNLRGSKEARGDVLLILLRAARLRLYWGCGTESHRILSHEVLQMARIKGTVGWS